MTDHRADPSRFDPRFDPAFQPGYDPRNDPAAAARVMPRRLDVAPPAQLAPPQRLTPAEPATRPRSGAPSDPPAAASESDPSLDDLVAGSTTESSETADDPSPVRGVNPFVITLWVASVVLVAAGITVFRSIPGLEQGSVATETGSAVSFGQVFSLSVLGPVFIGSGVLVAAGNVFLLAAGWRRRTH